LCDGIGGVLWEGALVISYLLEKIELDCHSHVLELGAGAGLTGLMSAVCGSKVTLTDRRCDLAEENILLLKEQYLHEKINLNVSSYELSWGQGDESKLLDLCGPVDVIIGAEIVCLRKQQENLMNTIRLLAGPDTIVLLSYDDIPMPSGGSSDSSNNNEANMADESDKVIVSKYEEEMNKRMQIAGFLRAVICTATVDWQTESNIKEKNIPSIEEVTKIDRQKSESISTKSYAVIHDNTRSHYNDLSKVSIPNLCHVEEINDNYGANPKISSSSSLTHHIHHVTAYYRQSATRVCSRCHMHFFPNLNKKPTCLHHPGYYVCRYHPGKRNCDVLIIQ
jgi:hypothetical protein